MCFLRSKCSNVNHASFALVRVTETINHRHSNRIELKSEAHSVLDSLKRLPIRFFNRYNEKRFSVTWVRASRAAGLPPALCKLPPPRRSRASARLDV